jgi:hypothetical protein
MLIDSRAHKMVPERQRDVLEAPACLDAALVSVLKRRARQLTTREQTFRRRCDAKIFSAGRSRRDTAGMPLGVVRSRI